MLNQTKLAVLIVLVLIFAAAGCGKKKEVPNAKFLGTYKVNDTWGSSKPLIGSGSLEYEMTITADGENAVILNNLNKTLDGVKAKVSGDSLLISKQTLKSKSGSTYDVDEKVGVLKGSNINIIFGYDDLNYADAIGYVYAELNGVKNSSPSDK